MTGHATAASLSVRTDISGAKVVVQALNRDAYIEARADVRHPGKSFVEFVRSGQVRERHVRDDSTAPELVIDLIRKHLS